jgi:DNA-binding LacI/PurR family transcriptional regulator
MSERRPTIRTLAAEAGVSTATVSWALRNSPEVSVSTRRRIQRLAKARGYRPDPLVAKLMHALKANAPVRFRASIVGLVDTWPEAGAAPREPNYRDRLCDGLRDRADSLGYGFDLFRLDDYSTPSQAQRVLLSRGIEGVVILPLRHVTDLSGRLDWGRFSTVSVTSSVSGPHFHSVMPHHFENIRNACRCLAAAGHRRIGLAMSREWSQRVSERWTAGIVWQNAFGGTDPVAPLIDPNPGLEFDITSFKAWLARERPDAVIAETIDKRLPRRRRPAIITMNWPNGSADGGIDQLPERIGSAAIEILAGLISRSEKGLPAVSYTTMVDGQWRVATKLFEKELPARTPGGIGSKRSAV